MLVGALLAGSTAKGQGSAQPGTGSTPVPASASAGSNTGSQTLRDVQSLYDQCVEANIEYMYNCLRKRSMTKNEKKACLSGCRPSSLTPAVGVVPGRSSVPLKK